MGSEQSTSDQFLLLNCDHFLLTSDYFLLTSIQILGEKPELPEAQNDDLKADASHRKQARLYKVTS